MTLRKASMSLLLAAALFVAPLWAVTTDDLLKKITVLNDQVIALQKKVNELDQKLAQQQAVVKISGGNVTVSSPGTLDLKGALVRLNGGGKPALGGVVTLPPGTPICIAPDRGGPCLGQGTVLASGSPTVLVP